MSSPGLTLLILEETVLVSLQTQEPLWVPIPISLSGFYKFLVPQQLHLGRAISE